MLPLAAFISQLYVYIGHLKSVKHMSQEEVPFNTDVSRHIFSLFASLYDSRASPYMGPMAVSDYAGEEEDEEPEVEAWPSFESSLCDFRLRHSYANEEEARANVLSGIAAKVEGVHQKIESGEHPDEFVIGERLPARSPAGKSSEAELQKTRRDNAERAKQKREDRRKKACDARRARRDKMIEDDAHTWRDQMRRQQEQARADATLRQKRADERLVAMKKRREDMEARKEREFELIDEANRALKKTWVIRTPNKENAKSKGELDDERKREATRSREIRLAAGSAAMTHNRRNFKPLSP